MSVYVGSSGTPWRGKTWYHLSADTEEELHTFAKERLNLKREWFQKHLLVPHYDVTESKRKKAIMAGAVILDRNGEVKRLQDARKRFLAPHLTPMPIRTDTQSGIDDGPKLSDCLTPQTLKTLRTL